MTGHPLSFPQRRLWFLEQLQPGLPVYHVPLGYRVRGPLDVEALRAALTALVERHEVLRTAYRVVDGEPRQFVLPAGEVPLPIVSDVDDASFDLATGEVFRAALVRHGPDEHRLLLTLHHIACDAATVGVLCRDLAALYAGEPLPPLRARYADFAEAQATRPVPEETVRYWRDRLGDATPTALPADLPRPAVQTFRGAHVEAPLPPDAVTALAGLARREGTTLFTALLAAFGVLVARCAGEDDVVVGVPVAVRDRAEYAELAGFFANTLVLRLDVSGRPSFTALLRRCWAEVAGGIAHASLPFEQLVEELHPERDLAHNPLFGVLFSMRDEDGAELALPGCDVTPDHDDTGTAKFDLTLSLTRVGESVSARLEYCTDLYRAETAERMLARFRTLLLAIAAGPDVPVTELNLLPPAELDLLAGWSRGPELSTVEYLPDMVARQASAAPDEVALVAGGRTMTRAELLAAADEVADRLRARGIGPDVPVGVYLDRTPELLVAMLGVLRAGAAYLPLDPTYPADRLAFMVGDSGCPVVLTRRAFVRRARGLRAPVLLVDEPGVASGPRFHSPTEDRQFRDGETADRQSPGGGLDRLAYVIYTSGSTGLPKGVQVTHRNLAAFGAGMDQLLGTEPGVWLALTSFSFDISVLELLWTLARGYRVVLQGDRPAAGAPPKVPEFSLFYFGNSSAGAGPRYRLLLDGARFADRNGFTAVWTPERHFHSFGGLYPNPSVTGAAVAAVTERVAVRAGSVVLPLHDPLRVAEEWSVVDHLSGGRVGISFASGWHARDFALAPDRYADRKALMLRTIEEVRALWRGEPVHRPGGTGEDVELRVFPRPLQENLPVWLTSAKSPETFQAAGELGAGLLTHLLGHDTDELAEKIALYRRSWHGDGEPHVTVMLHTFLGEDRERVRARVRDPLSAYLRTSIDLLSNLGGLDRDIATLPDDELTALVDRAFDRFFSNAALLGTPEDAVAVVERLAGIGVDEVACLVDFGVDEDAVLDALPLLAELRDLAEERHRAGAALEPEAVAIRRHGVTHVQCTPSLARVLADDPDTAAALGSLRALLVGGEALPPDLAARLTGVVHNMYGPTEATIWATSAPVAGPDVRIGRPLAGVRAHVVDRELRLAPAGVPGELLLGGPGVAVGYLGRPELTAERFVTGPDGERAYRTGDLVRWGPDGSLEFLGRLDHQVKLRGHRIELGEIETVLAQHPEVGQAVAAVRGEGPAAALVAWYTGKAEPRAVRAHLATRLPDYMVPAHLAAVDTLPLTPNGKLDRNALPDNGAEPARAAFRPAEGELERTIAEIWRETLRLDKVGLDDNFFDLGGNSLLLLGVRTELLGRLPRPVSLVDMFRYPTVGTLAAALQRTEPAETTRPVAEVAGRRRAGLARQARARQAGRGHD